MIHVIDKPPRIEIMEEVLNKHKLIIRVLNKMLNMIESVIRSTTTDSSEEEEEAIDEVDFILDDIIETIYTECGVKEIEEKFIDMDLQNQLILIYTDFEDIISLNKLAFRNIEVIDLTPDSIYIKEHHEI